MRLSGITERHTRDTPDFLFEHCYRLCKLRIFQCSEYGDYDYDTEDTGTKTLKKDTDSCREIKEIIEVA
jgi:hypothetical protein